MGAEVVGDDGDVVVGAQRVEEGDAGVLHVADEVVGVGGELEQHNGGDWGLGHADAGDGLLDAVFLDEEVSGFKAWNELVGLVEDDVDVEVDDGNVNSQGVGGVVGVLDLGLLGGGRRLGFGVVGAGLFLDNDAAVIGRGRAFLWGGVGCCFGGRGLLLGGADLGDGGCGEEEAEHRGGEQMRGPGKEGGALPGLGLGGIGLGRGHHVKLYSEIHFVLALAPGGRTPCTG